MRVIDFGPNELKTEVGQSQLLGYGRQIGELKPKRVHVRPEAGERQLLGRRHAADRMILIEYQRPQPGARQIASAGQSVVAGTDNDCIIRCHAAFSLCSATFFSITSQIMAAMSGPPNCCTWRMPVGEVTLISVR